MKWHADVNAALSAAAQLAAALRAEPLDLAAAQGRCELLLQHLDAAAQLAALDASKPPGRVEDLRDDGDQDWNGPSFRYSPDQ